MKRFQFLCLFLPVSLGLFAQPDSSAEHAYNTTHYTFHQDTKFLAPRSLLLPVAMVGYGFASLKTQPLHEINLNIKEEVTELRQPFHTRVDDYLKYAPAAMSYVLDASGVKAKHSFIDRTIILAVATTFSNQLVAKLKHATNELRPDGSTYNSFPSGHTTTAFIGAEIIHQEYGDRSTWYSAGGYTLAAATGGLRIMNNRHWLGDVVAGAGLGILSTKLTYWAYYKIKPRFTHQKSFY